jgi:DNA-binding MarR family transcriptional regulator
VTLDDAIAQVQLAYPQIYYACYTRHQRARTSADGLSGERPSTLSELTAHLNLSASTVSEAISAMSRHGFVAKSRGSATDKRAVSLTLTPRGLQAVRANSVLEDARVRGVLKTLSRHERDQAIAGLTLLAGACRRRGKGAEAC